jgi:hypothetical protein
MLHFHFYDTTTTHKKLQEVMQKKDYKEDIRSKVDSLELIDYQVIICF